MTLIFSNFSECCLPTKMVYYTPNEDVSDRIYMRFETFFVTFRGVYTILLRTLSGKWQEIKKKCIFDVLFCYFECSLRVCYHDSQYSEGIFCSTLYLKNTSNFSRAYYSMLIKKKLN